jgi:hypothetical protein
VSAKASRVSSGFDMAIMQTSIKTSTWLFLITFALVFYGMGAASVESFVNYPTWPLTADGLSLPLINRLRVTSFWLRRVPHIANAFLFLLMMSGLLRGSIRRSADG